jgi:hypothetical protein
VYCFDLGEVFSSVCVNPGADAPSMYMAFRNEAVLLPITELPAGTTAISAKMRILNGNYNSKALVELAKLELALMERNLKSNYGGLAGSSAVDIVNVVRGIFAAALDVRALSAGDGSVLYWYDIAGSVGVAMGRGLKVLVMGADGLQLTGGDHDIYTPVACVIARPDVFDAICETVRSKVGTHMSSLPMAQPVAG